MNDEILMTVLGKKLLDQELEQLVKVERAKIQIAISEARAHGDLKENADYQAAKEKQSLIEGRIKELQHKVAKAKIIEPKQIQGTTKVVFGTTVTISDDTGTSITYILVGEDEAKTAKNKIFYKSPLGSSLIGKEMGDTVIVKAPKGDREYTIENIEYN